LLENGVRNRDWLQRLAYQGRHLLMRSVGASDLLQQRSRLYGDGLTAIHSRKTGRRCPPQRRNRMQHDHDHDFCRFALAQQVLDECERRGLRVWQQFGAAYVARPVRGRLVSAPRHWRRVVEALSYEIACLLDLDCGWGCTVERLPESNCLLYRPDRWHWSASGHRTASGSAAA
jgi:hypothetical protein